MDRRGFLGGLLGSALAVPLGRVWSFPTIIRPKFTHQQYALGFRVTREMVEDEFYGSSLLEIMNGIPYQLQVEYNRLLDARMESFARSIGRTVDELTIQEFSR